MTENDLDQLFHSLQQSPFGDLVEPASVASMCSRGLGDCLFPPKLKVVRKGLDDATPPYYEVEPSLEDLEAEPDKERLAWAILINDIRPDCERRRALIRSVADAGWIGAITQLQLVPPEPRRKIAPWWYKPRGPKPPTERNLPSLFALFAEVER
jgi:hypothetical protein